MADKDDLFQKKDDNGHQNSDVSKSTPDEDDDVIDLLDSVQSPDDADDVIELSEDDMVADENADVIELTEDVTSDDVVELTDTIPPEDEDVLDLTEAVESSEEDVLELSDIVKTLPPEDDEVLEPTQEIDASEADDVIELTETAAAESSEDGDDILDLTEEAALEEADEELVELTETAAPADPEPESEEPGTPAYEETISLDQQALEESVTPGDAAVDTEPAAEPEDEDKLVELTGEAEDSPVDSGEGAPDTTGFEETVSLDQGALGDSGPPPPGAVAEDETPKRQLPAREAETTDEYDETIALDQTAMPGPASTADHAADAEAGESTPSVAEPAEIKPAAPAPKPYEEDKELLELIDDIQATLDSEPQKADAADDDPAKAEEAPPDSEDQADDSSAAYEFMDDHTVLDDPDIPDAESELYDHLGIDLTSEIERKAFEEMQEAVIEKVQPPESKVAPSEGEAAKSETVKRAVKEALSDMLTDENSPLIRAIEKAVRKAVGQ